ncbi:hypothetical protein E2C01_009150 [Portunus trituberculatus]|uniref:Uncharacterized protein n=1 Tax=Portunus trituberculatus TaxID=210409 RepID=A0A5B7D448_PORTR|nr:hypothetical protein [Portunus trituberculatus]
MSQREINETKKTERRTCIVWAAWLLTCVGAQREGTPQNVNHRQEIAKPSCPDLYEGHPREQVLSAFVKPRPRETVGIARRQEETVTSKSRERSLVVHVAGEKNRASPHHIPPQYPNHHTAAFTYPPQHPNHYLGSIFTTAYTTQPAKPSQHNLLSTANPLQLLPGPQMGGSLQNILNTTSSLQHIHYSFYIPITASTSLQNILTTASSLQNIHYNSFYISTTASTSPPQLPTTPPL